MKEKKCLMSPVFFNLAKLLASELRLCYEKLDAGKGRLPIDLINQFGDQSLVADWK
jgi:hypothetical protein